jgi:hypothetical protein
MLAVDPSAERQGLGTVPRCSPCSVLQWTVSSCPTQVRRARTEMSSVCGLCSDLARADRHHSSDGTESISRTHLRPRRNPPAVMAAWRIAPPDRFIGDRLQPVLSGHALEGSDSNAPGTLASPTGRPGCRPRASRFRGGAHRPGNRHPGERGHRDLCLADTHSPWNSLHARLTRAAGWGEAVQQRRTAPVRSGVAWFVA